MNFHSLIYCILTKVLCTCMSNLWAPDTYHFKAELWVGTKKKSQNWQKYGTKRAEIRFKSLIYGFMDRTFANFDFFFFFTFLGSWQ